MMGIIKTVECVLLSPPIRCEACGCVNGFVPVGADLYDGVYTFNCINPECLAGIAYDSIAKEILAAAAELGREVVEEMMADYGRELAEKYGPHRELELGRRVVEGLRGFSLGSRYDI